MEDILQVLNKKTIVLCNGPMANSYCSCSRMSSKNIPFIGAQHGIAIEIFENYDFPS